ncbi:MAG: hypothetical protein AB1806_07495 [Acidobacteriota bacterium]
MSTDDLLAALQPVLAAFRDLDVPHFVGGSLASSTHGVARASIDVDIIAELEPAHVRRFVAALGDAYYADESRIQTAVQRRGSFNLIHLATMFKVDVFVSRQRAFDRSSFARAGHERLDSDPEAAAVPLASAEDVLLAKLEWYRRGGEVSERQWTDVLGILRVGQATLDFSYLNQWAAVLGVADLLQRAIAETT